MAYKSERQKAWAHSDEGTQALGLQKVQEWDQASKDLKLPERISKSKPHLYPQQPKTEPKPKLGARKFAKFAAPKKWKSL